MKVVDVKLKPVPVRIERFSICPGYTSVCFCRSAHDAIECRLGFEKPIDFDEHRRKPAGFCPVIQSLN